MFTGIIEQAGSITAIQSQKGNKSFWINSPLSASLKIDQSVCHDGVCLTVEEIVKDTHRVTAIAETLAKTNLNDWKEGTIVNLERCMQLNGRLDGHLVQGHTDALAECIGKRETNGSWQFVFSIPEQFGPLIIEKGSVSLNGISLTIFNVGKNQFEVAIIPYTYAHTNIQTVAVGSRVNIEFDVIGKYVIRNLEIHNRIG